MAKRSQIQIALDKIDAEIADLQRVRERLAEALAVKDVKPKATRKSRASKQADGPNAAS